MPGSFLDTNVLFYLASRDVRRADLAEKLINLGGTISIQVLNELAHAAKRKIGLSIADIRLFESTFRSLLRIEPLTVHAHELGLDIAERHRFSIYDSMIVASALLAGCDVLWSEDMQHGQVIDGRLTIKNPFA